MKIDIQRHGTLTENRTAIFSDCGLYRFLLSIVWTAGKPLLVVIMLNPSKATHLENDPTIERICRRALLLGYGGVVILNAFAWRETDRLKMLKVSDPIGQLNDGIILDQLQAASAHGWTVLVGWGNEGGHRGRDKEIVALLARAGVQAVCLKRCANGQPQHPLYIGYDQPMIPWP